MKFLQIDGWGLFFQLVAEDACRAFEELVRRENDPPDRFLFRLTPLFDLVGMNIELLGKFGEGLFTADGGKGHLRFESRTVVPAGSSGHGSSPVLGKIADLQAEISPNHAVQISRATSIQAPYRHPQPGCETGWSCLMTVGYAAGQTRRSSVVAL
jgi:hypothetical protein